MGMSTEEEIVEALKKKDLSKYPNVSDSWRDLERGLWVLWIIKDENIQPRITAKTISFILLRLKELSSKEKSITNAFRPQIDKMVKVVKENSKTYYEILAAGKDHIRVFTGRGDLSVLFVSGKNPWSDPNKHFVNELNKLKGEFLIVDKFFGLGTLHTLSNFKKDRKIRFLTAGETAKNEDIAKLKSNTAKFKTEYSNIQLGKYSKGFELHDRYLISDDAFAVIGNGFKDMGGKESFVIIIKKERLGELYKILRNKFEERWKIVQGLSF